MHNLSHHRARRWTPARLPLAALAVLGFAVGAQPAAAADNKAVPGSACQRWGNITDGVTATDGAGILNASFTSALTVSCPVVRDNTTNGNGTGDAWVYVYRDGATATQLSCIFKSTRATDGTDFYSNTRSTAAVGNVRLTIPVTSSSAGGFYNILCVLPARSKVHGYLVPEY